jgi:hypothetical protein
MRLIHFCRKGFHVSRKSKLRGLLVGILDSFCSVFQSVEVCRVVNLGFDRRSGTSAHLLPFYCNAGKEWFKFN